MIKNKDNKKFKSYDIKFNVSMSLAFIIIGFFLWYNPNYFGDKNITYPIIFSLSMVGVINLGIALNKLIADKNNLGPYFLGIGLGFGILWVYSYYYLPNIWWANAIIFSPLLLSITFIIYGLISTVSYIFSNVSFKEGKKIALKIILFIFQLAGFILIILQIINIFLEKSI